LPATDGAYQREHLVDAGNQHRPQVVRWAQLANQTYLEMERE
jgi:hypothetical protein